MKTLKEVTGVIMVIGMCFFALFGGNIIEAQGFDAGYKKVASRGAQSVTAISREAELVSVEAAEAEIVRSAPESGIVVPEYIVEITEEVGQAYHISPELLQAIAWRESRFDPDAVSSNGACFGVMQVSEKWHSDRLLPGEKLTDPQANIRVAAEYLSELFERYRELDIVLMKYNGDSRALEPGYISGYARDVMELAEELENRK